MGEADMTASRGSMSATPSHGKCLALGTHLQRPGSSELGLKCSAPYAVLHGPGTGRILVRGRVLGRYLKPS